MKMNQRIIRVLNVLVCTTFLIGFLQSYQVHAQVENASLYILSQDMTSHKSTIWNVNSTKAQAESMFTMNAVSDHKANEVLSERELSVMQSFDQKAALPLQSAPISQYIQQVQRLDADQLMMLTSNSVCNLNTMNLCFGYYELLRLNTTDSSKTTSLMKVDYHPKVFDDWGCIKPTNEPIIIDQLLINPTHDILVYTLKASHDCYSKRVTAQTIIVDFSKVPVSITEIPMARGVSWSPDGNQLAYYSVTDCPEAGCETSVKVMTLFNNESTLPIKPTTTTLATITITPNTFKLPTAWINNNTLLYQWYGGIEEGNVLMSYNLDNRSQSTIHTSNGSSVYSLYYLRPSHTLLQNQTSLQDLSGSADGTTTTNAINSAQTVFYNSRFPDRVLSSNQIGCMEQISLLDVSTFQETPVSLSSILPKSECAIYATR